VKKRLCYLAGDEIGGGKEIRTPGLLNAIQALYQLSYTPKIVSRWNQRKTCGTLRHLMVDVNPRFYLFSNSHYGLGQPEG